MKLRREHERAHRKAVPIADGNRFALACPAFSRATRLHVECPCAIEASSRGFDPAIRPTRSLGSYHV
jgi:hypothetical protein